MTIDPKAELARLRASIDNIDAAVVHMLAERFKATKAVGELKAAEVEAKKDLVTPKVALLRASAKAFIEGKQAFTIRPDIFRADMLRAGKEAFKLLAKKAPVKAVLGYYGVDDNNYTGYFVKSDSPIKTARDLIGKKVAVNTLGAHHEFMVREFLERAKLTDAEAKQVTLVVTPPVSGEQALRQNHVEVSALGGVLRDKALERGGIRPLFTDQDLYGNFTAGSIVLHNKFLEQNPKASKHLVAALTKAIEWTRKTPPAEVRAHYEKIIKARNRAESPETIQYWKSNGVPSVGGVILEKDLQVWIDWLVKDEVIKAGQVKPSDLYTNALNPYAAGAKVAAK